MEYHELQNIFPGIGSQEPGNFIQTVAHKLDTGKTPGEAAKKDSLTKQQEEKIIIELADVQHWYFILTLNFKQVLLYQ